MEIFLFNFVLSLAMALQQVAFVSSAYVITDNDNNNNIAPFTLAPPPPVPGFDDNGFACLGSTNKCYKVFADKVDQKTAREKCHALGASLASIHSEAENNFIIALMDEADLDERCCFWIGMFLHRHSAKESLILGASWMDGTAVDFGDPRKIAPGTKPWRDDANAEPEPNNHRNTEEERCVNIWRDGWNDQGCASTVSGHDNFKDNGYVCQKP